MKKKPLNYGLSRLHIKSVTRTSRPTVVDKKNYVQSLKEEESSYNED